VIEKYYGFRNVFKYLFMNQRDIQWRQPPRLRSRAPMPQISAAPSIEPEYKKYGSKRRDNEVVHMARAFAQQAQLDQAIAELNPALGPDVVRLRYTLGQDWTGDPAIFFRILLSDRASRRDQLYTVTTRIRDAVVQHLEPFEQWGVLPYFSYRSQAEQAVLEEEAWA